ALIERGGCRFDNKIGRAVLAGATGAIVYNNAAGGEALVAMGGNNPVTLPDGTVVNIDIAGIFVQRSTGLALVAGTPPVTARAAAVFNGWGYMKVVDISDPASPVQIGEWRSPATDDEARATEGTFTIHNPEVVGNRVFASWYNEGFFVIDISKPSAPRQIGHWAGAGAPAGAPPVNLWSVVPHGDLLLASDRSFGLYILRLKP
ncbi:MAG TPA: PA domain-containing protein, partial [Actinomycetota bacterium]|nr:PA domain-containing protein [Actinomycetota bacterium]